MTLTFTKLLPAQALNINEKTRKEELFTIKPVAPTAWRGECYYWLSTFLPCFNTKVHFYVSNWTKDYLSPSFYIHLSYSGWVRLQRTPLLYSVITELLFYVVKLLFHLRLNLITTNLTAGRVLKLQLFVYFRFYIFENFQFDNDLIYLRFEWVLKPQGASKIWTNSQQIVEQGMVMTYTGGTTDPPICMHLFHFNNIRD